MELAEWAHCKNTYCILLSLRVEMRQKFGKSFLMNLVKSMTLNLLCSMFNYPEPTNRPDSGTVNFWDEWAKDEKRDEIANAVVAWRRQSQK